MNPLARLLASLAMLFFAGVFPLAAQSEKRMGVPRPDKALVYVVREKYFIGGGVGMYVFADDQFLAFVRNGSYGFGYVDPGRRLIWGDVPTGIEAQLIAGETYYIAVKFTSPIIILSEAEGKQAIASVASFTESDDSHREKAAKKIAKRFAKAQEKEARKDKADVEQVSVAAPAAGAVLLPLEANTKLKLELMENLSSGLNRAGDAVWLRTSEDVIAEGTVLVPRGSRVKATVRSAKTAGSFGEQGILDVALISVDLSKDTRLPLLGQLSAAGDARATGVMLGIVGGAFVKGTEAFYPSGTHFSAWTREKMGLPPAASLTTPAPPQGTALPPIDLLLEASARKEPPPVLVSLPCGGDLTEVALVAVGDWTLPEPLAALAVTRSGDRCTATFPGWGLRRLVPPSEAPRPLHFQAKQGAEILRFVIPTRLKVE